LAFADDPPRLAPDLSHKLGGRGVSVHAKRSCIVKAAERGGFARALKRPIDVDATELIEAMAGQLARRIEGLLLAASRQKRLAIGTDAVREAIATAAGPRLLVVASDAMGRRAELTEAALRLGGRCVVFGDKARLGRLFGRDEVGVIAVLDAGLAEEIARAGACLDELSEDA
jgi:predicted RNA-binding protein YlxR (DUF448 family)